MAGKYMAYVGSYSYNGQAKGITVYDVDVENGYFKYRCEVEVDNSSYLAVSHDGKTLYSIADEGVVSFRILPNGGLTRLNSAGIKGMRGCHLATDAEDKYIFVSGYHDGKETILRLNPDGTVGEITDKVFHKGLGSVAERNFRPHVSCAGRTPDGEFLMAADLGIDQVKIYGFDSEKGTISQVDAVRCELESAPRQFVFSKDGRFFYLMYQLKNAIDVYSYEYEPGERVPKIERLQTVSSTDTPAGELGETLSGGERQRIGLARVFLHDAPFVLLDEPTSNLDSLNEAAVLRALSEGRGDKTVVLVSHRASTAAIADVEYTVDRGRLG